MFPKEVNGRNVHIIKDVGEMGKLNYSEEGRLELEKEIEELKGRIEIGDENMEKKLEGGKKELRSHKETRRKGIGVSRERVQESDR